MSTSDETTASTSDGIGFIGLGIMGEGMAGRLLTEGVAGGSTSMNPPLIIWNRTTSKCVTFKEQYSQYNIIIKNTAKEVVESCRVTYSMLSTPEAAKAVFDAEDGVLAGMTDGHCIVDCATLAESDMQSMSAAITEKGGRFLEAPVSGSKVPAMTGTLIFLCAGNIELYNEVKDTGLKVMGKASHYFGEQVGTGTRAKLVVNSLMGTMMVAYGEGLALSEAVGLDPAVMIDVIGQGAIACPMYTLKGSKMIAGDHVPPNFPLKHATKDMTLAKQMANAAGVEYTVINQAESIFVQACNDSELNVGDEDFSAIYEKIHKDSTNDYSIQRMMKKRKM